MLTDRAPAKINLTLHVLGRRADGFHDLESLVAFAGVADHLSIEPAETLGIETEGPFAQAAGPAHDNLVLRAASALAARIPGLRAGRFRLSKRIPVAAGLGGGSSDAAAALRMLARLNGLAEDDPRLFEAAAETGSDVPVCLKPRASLMLGRGERVDRSIKLPRLHAVLVNPGVPLATGPVFKAMGLKPGEAREGAVPHPSCGNNGALLRTVADCRNDMEAAAISLEPAVGEALSLLRAQDRVQVARMSGSGTTVFALVDDWAAAMATARALRVQRPRWWVAATVLR